MITITKKPNGVSALLPCAQIQGAVPSRLHATVVLMAIGFAPVQGGAVGDVEYGGQGSRAWSPPV
ncbi:hypothetical protein [Kribbella sp. NPDC006257]|jgi:hypothetical protein|uniref:hypothetical protein n=1 Tax=Kribbella sp. NPDC006257 TaxID=3156738 RepID=UPI0033A98844